VFVVHQGHRTSKKVGSKQAAQEVASKIEAQLKLGEFNFMEEKPPPTFKEYADSWIKITVPATCKESTTTDYRDILRIHVGPVFNDFIVTDITRGKVKDFLMDKMNEGYAKSTVIHMKNVISSVLNKALDDEIIQANPAHRLGKNFLVEKRKAKAINPLSRSELKKLLDTVQKGFSDHYSLFLLLARTGMRIGEALALKWDDLDFTGRFITVEKSLVRGIISTPKNGKGRRVDMSLQLAEALRNNTFRSEYVFTNPSGTLIDKDVWRRRIFLKALEKADLRRIRVHDLRHSYATLRISKGDNIQDVAKQLGHHSVKLTLDVYSHWMPGKKKSEVDALDDHTPMHPPAPYTHPGLATNKKWNRQIGNPLKLLVVPTGIEPVSSA
jgi:integrase